VGHFGFGFRHRQQLEPIFDSQEITSEISSQAITARVALPNHQATPPKILVPHSWKTPAKH
jgi:superfamily II helicase